MFYEKFIAEFPISGIHHNIFPAIVPIKTIMYTGHHYPATFLAKPMADSTLSNLTEAGRWLWNIDLRCGHKGAPPAPP